MLGMSPATLTIDPRLPVLWRDPTSAQIGLDGAIVRFDALDEHEERMLAAVRSGGGENDLAAVATGSGIPPDRVAAFLERLEPALLPARDIRPLRVIVSGAGATATQLRTLLVASGTRLVDDPHAARIDLAIDVAHYVMPPAQHRHWLRRDIRHLPVVLGDSLVRVGPLVRPGDGPCVRCVELRLRDVDPAWPTLAAQVLGRVNPLDSGLLAAEIACTVTRLALAPVPLANGAALEIGVLDGVRRQLSWSAHEECGCGLPPGTATRRAARAHLRPVPTPPAPS